MARNWNLKINAPVQAVQKALNENWQKATKRLSKWLETDLVRAMVYGGFGIQGISQTAFYKWISSPDGLSQLGIEKSEPPKLLEAYERTIKVSRSGSIVKVKFGDVALLNIATPHPAAGTGNLRVASWLELIDLAVGEGFVPRNRLPKEVQKSIRIDTAPGGLMLPQGAFGSTGLWRFPAQLADYEDKWFRENISKVQKAVQDQLIVFLNQSSK